MAQQVIKRDGTKEPFDAEKIKRAIRAAGGGAGLPPERINELVEQVSGAVVQSAAGKEEITSSELREKALGELDRVEPSVAEAWKKHDKERAR